MLTSVNEKLCKPDAKIECNLIHIKPAPYRPPLLIGLTILLRYVLPFILTSVYLTPIVGLVSIFYPFSQIIPYFYVYTSVIETPSAIDYVLFYGGLVIMLGYYYYSFREVGIYAILQIGTSVIMSLIMYFIGPNLAWGIIAWLVNIFVTIYVDAMVIKSVKK